MGRPKIKEKKPPSSKEEALSGDNEDSGPSQRKRGRPRKAVKEEIDKVDSKEVGPSNEKVQASSSDTEKKRKRTENGNSGSSTTDKKGDTNGVSLVVNSKQTIVKREGNRRKGKPRRAAGASLDLK